MGRKKRKPTGGNSKRRRPSTSRPSDLANLPDRRAMEGQLRQLVRSETGAAAPNTPLEEAQEIMYRAFAEQDENRRVELAEEALALSADCADAWVLLAEHARGSKVIRELYQNGVAAGERALGPEAFREHVGHFWAVLETRPYMRAREGLAFSLWGVGRRDEAVRHLQDMLRLNPNDNLGLRYTLAGYLLFLDRDDELNQLLQQHRDEDSATWAYTITLLEFRQYGDTLEARQMLKRAKKANKYVPDYLLGRKFPPLEHAGHVCLGDESEAIQYVTRFLAPWKATPGAIAWLRDNDEQTRKRKKEAPHAKGPLSFVKKWLKERLLSIDDVWQADCRQLANWITIGGERVRPWTILVTSRTDDLVLAHELLNEPPSAAMLWDTLVKAMQHPAAGEPHRPTELQIRTDERWDSLRPHAAELDIGLQVCAELDQLEDVFDSMCESVCGKPLPGLLDIPGIKPEQVGSFYEAAAFFFQQAPWKKVGFESAIKVACDRYQSGPWYAVLMGQSGLTTGLALYDDLEAVQRTWLGEMTDEENARASVATVVTFGEDTTGLVADLEAAKKHRWKVARPDAYPSIFRKELGQSLRLPLAWELELVEGCLRAVPDFANRRKQDDSTKETMTVPVASGRLHLVLSWVVEGG